MLNGDGNENSQKNSVGLISKKKNFARAAHFFAHFFAVFFWHDCKRETSEDAYIPSPDSTQNSTVFRFPAIFTPCKSHDH